MDATKLKEQAKTAFEKSLQEKIDFLAYKCWPEKLTPYLQELNMIIKAGAELGVTTAWCIRPEDIEELVKQLHPYRVLNMGNAIRETLVEALIERGLDPLALIPEAIDQSPAALFKKGILRHVERSSSLNGFEEIIKVRLEEINAFLHAMETTCGIKIDPFSADEITEMEAVLRPLITIRATPKAAQHIIDRLIDHGVDASIFA